MAKKKLRFDDGGDVGDDSGDSGGDSGGDSSGDLSPITVTAPYMSESNNFVSPDEISALTAAAPTITPSAANASTTLLSDQQLNGDSSSNSSSSNSGGAIGALLKALGLGGSGSQTASTIGALGALLGAAGTYKQNSANTPKFSPPPLFGTSSSGSSSGSSSSTGSYGPPGGYNYANYAGANSGLGYAPRTQVTPNIPNYYTYGQGPQQQFYSTTPTVGTAGVPVAQKKGGSIKKFAAGGFNNVTTGQPLNQPGLPPRPVMQSRPTMTPHTLPQAPQMPQALPSMPQSRPATGMMPPTTGISGGSVPSSPPNSATVGRPMGGPMAMMATGGSMPSTGIANSPLQQVLNSNMRHTGQPGVHPYAQGGNPSRHVQGPGDGTSDSIPARLAQGEYVLDAQTVANIGNGDNSAGAKKLDAWRMNIRKHKGAALAQGKMAPDIHPDLNKYMPGGK